MRPTFSIENAFVETLQGDRTDEVKALIAARIRRFFGKDALIDQAEAGGGVRVTLSALRPLFDERLLREMVEICARERRSVQVEGAAGGTAPLSVEWAGSDETPYLLIWSTQFDQNVQLEINRLKRRKIFFALLAAKPDFHLLPIDSVFEYLASTEGTDFVIGYGENLALDRYEACPNCDNASTTAIRPGNSQPRIGYLTRNSSYYEHCGACGLVFLARVLPEAELYRLYDWYDKEGTTVVDEASFEPEAVLSTPYARNFALALDLVGDRVPADAATLDLGGGSGHFSLTAKLRYPGWQCSSVDFECDYAVPFLAKRGITAWSADFLGDELPAGSYDLISMFEVLEHLRVERLKLVWDKISRALKPGGHFVFSTPDFYSDFARATDFWVAFVPHHLTVLSVQVLRPMWEAAGLELVIADAESLLFSDGYGDFTYGSDYHSSMAARAEAAIMDRLLQLPPARGALREWMRETASGGEMIVVLRKGA